MNTQSNVVAGECSLNPPVRIFLQWNGDQEPDPTETVCLSEVTWCADRVFKHDVEYIRADRVQILLEALDGLVMPCTRADYTVARLDEVVSRLAKSALDDYANAQADL